MQISFKLNHTFSFATVHNKILSVFVAWITLSLALSFLYNGMDADGMKEGEKRMHCKGPPITEVLDETTVMIIS